MCVERREIVWESAIAVALGLRLNGAIMLYSFVVVDDSGWEEATMSTEFNIP